MIASLDVADAREAEGVHAVLTIDDLEAAGMDISMVGAVLKNRDGTEGAKPLRPMLAKGKVRFVGEPVAVIIADTMEQARDAAELIMLDVDEVPAHMGLVRGGEALHAEAPDNLAFDWGLGDEDATQKAFDTAAKTVSLDVGDNRIIVNSLEPRGCYAEWENGKLHVSNNGQGVWNHKDNLKRVFGLDDEHVRVTNPDTGGGFGMKGMTCLLYTSPSPRD